MTLAKICAVLGLDPDRENVFAEIAAELTRVHLDPFQRAAIHLVTLAEAKARGVTVPVQIAPGDGEHPTRDDLRQRYGLSQREAQTLLNLSKDPEAIARVIEGGRKAFLAEKKRLAPPKPKTPKTPSVEQVIGMLDGFTPEQIASVKAWIRNREAEEWFRKNRNEREWNWPPKPKTESRSRLDKLHDLFSHPETPRHEAAAARRAWERMTGHAPEPQP